MIDDWFAPLRGLIDVAHIERTVRLLVVGCGRVGLSFIHIAIARGVRWLRVIEPDWTESRNYASGFPEAAVGSRKIDFLREHLLRYSSRISFEGASARLTASSVEPFLSWLSRSTHVALFLDSFEVASALARMAYRHCPCLYAAVFENGSTGEAAWSLGGQTPCLESTVRLSEKRGARGGQTALVDVLSTVNVSVRQFLGLALAGRRGFELFAPYVRPRFPLAVVVNRPGGFVEMGSPDVPSGVRLVEVVDGNGRGPTCPTCAGYSP
ncbi:MAG: hypothetical protein FJ291_00095 [Planctomycetes bacterium]|nr:hypothetical protein [Planctomycetota bacterium]